MQTSNGAEELAEEILSLTPQEAANEFIIYLTTDKDL